MLDFSYDVFLSHSTADATAACEIATRLRADGIRVCHAGDAGHEHGLEHSRVLVLCMSANAFGAEWTKLEAGTLRFRDPANTSRRFVPLKLDTTPVPDSVAQNAFIYWLPDRKDYGKLLDACRGPRVEEASIDAVHLTAEHIIKPRQPQWVFAYAFAGEHLRVLTGGVEGPLRLWDVASGQSLRSFSPHSQGVRSIAWRHDDHRVVTGGNDALHVWDIERAECVRELTGHSGTTMTLAWTAAPDTVVSGSTDGNLYLWDITAEEYRARFTGHESDVWGVAVTEQPFRIVSASKDHTLRVWDMASQKCLRVLEGHTNSVRAVAWHERRQLAVTGGYDHTVRLWDISSGRCVRVLQGHPGKVLTVAFSPDGRHVLSGSGIGDNTARLWEVDTGRCLCVLEGHEGQIWGVAWHPVKPCVFSGDERGELRQWDLSSHVTTADTSTSKPIYGLPPDQIQYTNAKVLLVGDSSAGKTGLSKRLALDLWEPSDSTLGAWATQWKLPVDSNDGVEREIWLWDFGGQADQRLIHQLYMAETALAVLVFDGQKEDLFDVLGQWDRDLTRASRRAFAKLLVAGRVDAGRLRAASREQVEAFARERGFGAFIETSAKTGENCVQLRQAILDGIRWDDIPWRSSPVVFKRLKDEIVRLKDSGRVLVRFKELRDTLLLQLSESDTRFSDDELRAVISLLTGPGVVWELKFGSWVLLQPERINAYAQAVIQAIREDKHDRGCLSEERVLKGELTYQSALDRLEADEERFVLLAMHQTLVEHGLCFRERTEQGALLIFPSYYRRERPEQVRHPAVLVSYRFTGFLDDVYATLVVRLHHTESFTQDDLWRYAADFKTPTGKNLGIKLTRQSGGEGELDVYFEPGVPAETKIVFSKYVHEHLLQNATDVVRLRHYVCPYCNTPVGNREVAMDRLDTWLRQRSRGGKPPAGLSRKPTIICVQCEKRVPLWDELEETFASDAVKERVRELQEQSDIVLDSESKERALVGEVISTVALAGQLSREFSVSDHGIDMEVEFKSDSGEATGKKVYLQLKSGDSYLRERKRDGTEIFTVRDSRHVTYWRSQAFPVLLIIRSSAGEIRWMEIRAYLREKFSQAARVTAIPFVGEKFDVMAVRRWRERAFAQVEETM